MILNKLGLKNARELEYELGYFFFFFKEYTINDFFYACNNELTQNICPTLTKIFKKIKKRL